MSDMHTSSTNLTCVSDEVINFAYTIEDVLAFSKLFYVFCGAVVILSCFISKAISALLSELDLEGFGPPKRIKKRYQREVGFEHVI